VTLPLGLTPEAKADLLEARDWYDAQRPGWGAVFVRSADRSFRLRFRSRSGYGDYGKSLRGARGGRKADICTLGRQERKRSLKLLSA